MGSHPPRDIGDLIVDFGRAIYRSIAIMKDVYVPVKPQGPPLLDSALYFTQKELDEKVIHNAQLKAANMYKHGKFVQAIKELDPPIDFENEFVVIFHEGVDNGSQWSVRRTAEITAEGLVFRIEGRTYRQAGLQRYWYLLCFAINKACKFDKVGIDRARNERTNVRYLKNASVLNASQSALLNGIDLEKYDLKKYDKMKKMGLSEDGVRNKMRMDGIDKKVIATYFGEKLDKVRI